MRYRFYRQFRCFGHNLGFGFFFSFPPIWWFDLFESEKEYLEMLKRYREELKEELEKVEKEIERLEKESK